MFRSFIRVRPPPPLLKPLNARYKSLGKGITFTPPPAKPQQSVRLAAAVSQEDADIGLLVDTFIMPTGKNLPSLFTARRARLDLEKKRIKQRFMDIRDMLVFRYSTGYRIRPFQARSAAISLHRQMYTAFASADINTLRAICGHGLLSSFRKRLSQRPTNVRVEWKLHEVLERPRVVSSKAHHYMGINLNRRQVVVRLRSRQSVTKSALGKLGEVVSVEGGEVKEVLEYIVLEKKYEGGVESGWSVWGTTEETTVERLKRSEEQKRALGLM